LDSPVPSSNHHREKLATYQPAYSTAVEADVETSSEMNAVSEVHSAHKQIVITMLQTLQSYFDCIYFEYFLTNNRAVVGVSNGEAAAIGQSSQTDPAVAKQEEVELKLLEKKVDAVVVETTDITQTIKEHELFSFSDVNQSKYKIAKTVPKLGNRDKLAPALDTIPVSLRPCQISTYL
jgi:hypothetical protein